MLIQCTNSLSAFLIFDNATNLTMTGTQLNIL